MEKLVYVLWREPSRQPTDVERALTVDVAPAVLAAGVAGLRVTVEDTQGAMMRMGSQPDGSLLVATVSVWVDSLDGRAPIEEALAGAGCTTHGYLVTESVPLGYGAHRTWPDGEVSPGLSITTVFDKLGGLADEEFFRIWHGEHTPLSFDIHPIWLYVRNAVARPVTAGAPRLRSIVYEAVPTVEDLLDFHRFFGSGGSYDKLRENIERVNNHMLTFADMSSLQTTPTREYIFKTFST